MISRGERPLFRYMTSGVGPNIVVAIVGQPEITVTATRPAYAAVMARVAIAEVLEVAEDSFDVEQDVETP